MPERGKMSQTQLRWRYSCQSEVPLTRYSWKYISNSYIKKGLHLLVITSWHCFDILGYFKGEMFTFSYSSFATWNVQSTLFLTVVLQDQHCKTRRLKTRMPMMMSSSPIQIKSTLGVNHVQWSTPRDLQGQPHITKSNQGISSSGRVTPDLAAHSLCAEFGYHRSFLNKQ